MSLINFESARVKEELRNEKRKAREAVLEKAEADYKRRKEREQRAAERGENKWMLPSLDAQLQPDSHKKKKKEKDKKDKKKKKEKKHKKKKKHDSSESSESSESEEWVEEGAKAEAATSVPTQRDEWMTLPALFPCVSREHIRAQKKQDAPVDEEALKKKFLLDNPGQSDRELNPYWKDGGKGLPQMEEPFPESLSLAANSAGDHGVAWLRRALRRVQEQAKEQGRSEEAVASERWGSLEKLKNMLYEAERRCRTRPRDRGRGRGQRGGRMQGPAPKPKEYEDWREDPTAGESTAAQSEVVGDKSRYRSWLGIKDPSPKKESSSEEDEFDYDQLDDAPVIEGLETLDTKHIDIKTILENKKVLDEDNEGNDGRIVFRSSKIRKDNALLLKAKSQFKEKLTAFGRRAPEINVRVKENEGDSDDDEKLFEEWRKERRTKDSSGSDSEPEEKIESKDSVKKVIKMEVEENEIDTPVKRNEETKREQMTSDDLRERFFQARNKGKPLDNIADKDGKVEEVEQRRRGSEVRDFGSKYSNNMSSPTKKDISNDDRGKSETQRERTRNWNDDRSQRGDKKREKEDLVKYGFERDHDRKEGSARDRMDPSREKRTEERHGNRRGSYDRSKLGYEDVKETDTKKSANCDEYDRRSYSHKNRENEDYNYRSSRMHKRCDSPEERSYDDSLQRTRHTGSRRTEVPNYLQKQSSSPYEKLPPRRLEGFRKPEEGEDAARNARHDILGDMSMSRSSSGTKNWKKKGRPEEKVEMKEKSHPSNLDLKPLPNIQPIAVKQKEEEKQLVPQMTDAEMNALAAKVLKAEILGNHVLVTKLKGQLEQAQAARKQRGSIPTAVASTSKTQEEQTVILTQQDSKGFVRPVAAPTHPEPSGGRRKPQRVATHGMDGLRERFFPDDDKYTLENMFQQEKLTTMEDTNEEFCRLASKTGGRADSEYDLDDIFAEKMAREKAPGKLQALERNRAIQQHKRVERSLDSCVRCFDSPRMLKHLIVALGTKVYLSLPAHQSLTEGHCLLSPIHHVACATQLDEDVWEEMNLFRKALVAMFLDQDEDCIFFESAMNLRRFPHMVLECVPLPKEMGDTAPIYFKKAIMESEMEWSMNKKLVDLKGKGVRRAVPKGLPYFSVDFGTDDGFAHVIEDEKLFPENFAQEIIGGMLDLDHSLWRKQRRENFDTQRRKVIQFAEQWKKFDVTRKVSEDDSSTSSDSEKD